MIRVFSQKSQTEKHKVVLITIIKWYRYNHHLQRFPRMFSKLAVIHARLYKQFPNIRANAISVCQYLQLKMFINSASSSPSLKSCGEIIIINFQRILSIASSLSATNFCLSELGLCPSPSAAIFFVMSV